MVLEDNDKRQHEKNNISWMGNGILGDKNLVDVNVKGVENVSLEYYMRNTL